MKTFEQNPFSTNITIKVPAVLLGIFSSNRVWLLLLLFFWGHTFTKAQTQSDSIPTGNIAANYRGHIKAQTHSDSIPTTYRLTLDFPLVDFPFLNQAAQMNANRRFNRPAGNDAPVTGTDYRKVYFSKYNSLSMRQLLAVAEDLHGTGYFVNNLLWDKWIKPTNWRKRLLNRALANITALGPDYLLSYYLPFGNGYAHEEFHRVPLTVRGVSSFDEFWDKGNYQVTHVKDEDLAYMKARFPAELVRVHTAGIEAQYLFLRNMQKQNFFYKTRYPNIGLSVLLTNYIVNYANQTKDKDYDVLVQDVFNDLPTVESRDFNGDDFTTYTYELFRPNQPYNDRGIAPNGVGIARYLKLSQLTSEELDYLRKMGRMQYWNFLSPHLLGISSIKVNDNLSFNFAARHFLTSFGYDLGGDLFLKMKDKNILLTWHGYQNKDHFFPGVDAQLVDLPLKLSNKTLPLTLRTMLWLQPENQQFYTDKGRAGGLIYAQLRSPKGKTWQPYLEVEGKTQGWVAGNPYLDANFTVRAGVSAYFNFKPKK